MPNQRGILGGDGGGGGRKAFGEKPRGVETIICLSEWVKKKKGSNYKM